MLLLHLNRVDAEIGGHDEGFDLGGGKAVARAEAETRELAERARRLTVQSRSFLVASEDDLLNLKQIARANRTAPGDAEDIAFLEARLNRR